MPDCLYHITVFIDINCAILAVDVNLIEIYDHSFFFWPFCVIHCALLLFFRLVIIIVVVVVARIYSSKNSEKI